jgi:hypothetical protein
MRSFAIALLASACALNAQTLKGVVDILVHSDPDSRPRSIDTIDAIRLAQQRGFRAAVLKNHYESTASQAYLARKIVPGIEVFGGIALNLAVGGINAAAVERMPSVKGGYGRVVWMPTFDAENQVKYRKESRPFVSISRNGELLPEVKQMLAIIAKHKLVLATGHSSPAECLALIREARKAGVEQIVVTHAMFQPVKMTVEDVRQAASLGAYIEFVYNGIDQTSALDTNAAGIRAAGIGRAIVSSDMGGAGHPSHPDGLEAFFKLLRSKAFTEAEIDQMAKTNPARLLGLP